MHRIICVVLLTGLVLMVDAQKRPTLTPTIKEQTLSGIEARRDTYKQTALQIWNYAELGYKEVQSSALLQKLLKENGFSVEAGVAGIPTAFVATFGSGSPVIGLLAEYDALPGLAQEAVPEKKSIGGQIGGHGCGHHLFGTASVAAGISIKELIASKKITGTIKVYGCPAEEGGSGKVYMAREGLFNDLDAAIHWHPDSRHEIFSNSGLANKSAKFRFRGLSAHAAMAPERGRSSLDAVEAMNYMVNMMREHMPQDARIHYVITDGGKAPNVIPDFAEVSYYVRHPDRGEVVALFDRVVKAAEGAATGTETKMEFEIIGGTHEILINNTLAEIMERNLMQIGGFSYTAEEADFARKIRSTLDFKVPDINSVRIIQSPKAVDPASGGSSDVGDVSYTVPTVGAWIATWAPGVPAHSWQAVACGGTEIGIKGMMLAAKTMALTAIDLYYSPTAIAKAKAEHVRSVGDYKYEALLGDRKPALNYRD
ncbi:MAG TPA: amidohydrolase [Phnomibacter sp.]|nr:amidohydrolase [Phnomibacter sp.]